MLVTPCYWAIALFAVPFITFGAITYFTAKARISTSLSAIISGWLIVSFGILAVCLFAFIILDSATTTTTDVSRYKQALTQMGYPSNLTNAFPPEIPEKAENIKFSYHPAFGQGGEQLTLRFETDADAVRSYQQFLTEAAVWFGQAGDKVGERYGIFDGTLNIFFDGRNKLPDDLVIYVVFSEPYRPNNWNHGELSFVGISEETLEVMFYAEDW